jgi:Uma2 family endonuclease
MPSTLNLSLLEFDRMVRVGAFDRIDRKVELIHGELIEMYPAGPLHDYLVTFLINWSVRNAKPEVTVVTSQTGLELPEGVSLPEPDVMWLKVGRYRNRHPQANEVQLAIEVSHTSLDYDLETKRHLYAQSAIREYWIVDVVGNCVHVLQNPNADDYKSHQTFEQDAFIAPQIAPLARLNLNELFAI